VKPPLPVVPPLPLSPPEPLLPPLEAPHDVSHKTIDAVVNHRTAAKWESRGEVMNHLSLRIWKSADVRR
jgi:hypothetical protein